MEPIKVKLFTRCNSWGKWRLLLIGEKDALIVDAEIGTIQLNPEFKVPLNIRRRPIEPEIMKESEKISNSFGQYPEIVLDNESVDDKENVVTTVAEETKLTGTQPKKAIKITLFSRKLRPFINTEDSTTIAAFKITKVTNDQRKQIIPTDEASIQFSATTPMIPIQTMSQGKNREEITPLTGYLQHAATTQQDLEELKDRVRNLRGYRNKILDIRRRLFGAKTKTNLSKNNGSEAANSVKNFACSKTRSVT